MPQITNNFRFSFAETVDSTTNVEVLELTQQQIKWGEGTVARLQKTNPKGLERLLNSLDPEDPERALQIMAIKKAVAKLSYEKYAETKYGKEHNSLNRENMNMKGAIEKTERELVGLTNAE